jgi:hypothetical protein
LHHAGNVFFFPVPVPCYLCSKNLYCYNVAPRLFRCGAIFNSFVLVPVSVFWYAFAC